MVKLATRQNVGWPTEGGRLLASACLLVAGASAWRFGSIGLFLTTPFLLAGIVFLALPLARYGAAERMAAALCGVPAGTPLSQSLARIALKIEAFAPGGPEGQKSLNSDNAFLRDIDLDIGRRSAPGLLGVVRFCDFDRIALFDRHDANRMLTEFSRRLAQAAGQSHAVSRIDRDSFGIWYRGEGALAQFQAEFRSLVYVASQEIRVGERVFTATVEAASATFPKDGADAGQLILSGLASLARAGVASREDTTEIGRRLTRSDREDFELEQDLAQAIDAGELSMAYQPVVDLPSGRLLGAEALLRWTHPRRGHVPPSRFVPVMEAVGLSDRFGLWVLNAACKEARRWRDDGQNSLKVAVNLSARQLLDPTLQAKIQRTLDRHGLPAAALELELTETAAMADAALTRRLFSQLRDMGLSLAIDDFGAGYSSLSYLKNLPFDKLKIDREFVTDVHRLRDSQAICRALIELGRGLDLQVLAEGVEAAAELDTLQSLGCHIFQGFLIARPMPADAFRAVALDGLCHPSRPGIASPALSQAH
jgi:EAL domain-containing protein (putative c-di-GMP-specific phosphodiesterase class I)/GGDEF domain-containing protein